MKKKLISIALVIILALGMLGIITNAASAIVLSVEKTNFAPAPLRFVAVAGGTVSWDVGTQTASITSGGGAATVTTPIQQPAPTPTQTDPPSENNNLELVGHWTYIFGSNKYYEYGQKKSMTVYTYMVEDVQFAPIVWTNKHHYYFYADGTFMYFSAFEGTVCRHEGKYTVADGKVYFTERKFYNAGSKLWHEENYRMFEDDYPKWVFHEPPQDWNDYDQIVEYQLGSNSDGDYLQITDQQAPKIDNTVHEFIKEPSFFLLKAVGCTDKTLPLINTLKRTGIGKFIIALVKWVYTQNTTSFSTKPGEAWPCNLFYFIACSSRSMSSMVIPFSNSSRSSV